ncbi:MAG: HAMP domain-containing sensor histidine kinase [bacterium]
MDRDPRTDELLTLGLVGLGLAHELNSPLTVAALGLELLSDRLRGDAPPDPHAAADAVDRVLAGVRRMGALVDRFRRFARGEGGQPVDVALDEVADAVHAMVRPALAEISTVALVRAARVEEARVHVDPLLLEQAVAIVTLNAADAMRGRGGRISIAVGVDGDDAAVVVEDDGAGFAAPDDAVRIGYSSKGAAGMGVGLPLARRIVEEAGGSVTIENRAEGGARVSLRLPRLR